LTLVELLERAALRRPDADAVVDGARRLSYAELATRADALGAGFRGLGVRRGDRVLIVLRNRLEHVLACGRGGRGGVRGADRRRR
jgi:2,3-dihydroxybenzoate-AMP ligase